MTTQVREFMKTQVETQSPKPMANHGNPEWKKVKADSEATWGPLTKRMDSYFMDPTSFSALNR